MHLEFEYSLLFPDLSPGAVMLMPDDHTSARRYLTEPLVPGKPLRFTNGFDDMLPSPDMERVEDMLFDGMTFAVRDKVQEVLERQEHPGLQLYPMIFTDSLDQMHSDYYYLNLYGERDFLDLELSELMPPLEDSEPDDPVMVLRYRFDQAKIASVPKEERLIFRLKDVLNASFMVHHELLSELEAVRASGYRAFRVADFREGMQN